MKTLTRSLAASCSALTLAGLAHAEPPRWVVTDEDSRLVLFPTIHVLSAETDWLTADLLTALAAAEEVWFELPQGPEAAQEAQAAMTAAGVDPSRPLSEVPEPDLYARTLEAAESFGLTAQQVEPLRPWLVAVTLFGMELARSGMTGGVGADAVLDEASGGRTRRALETAAAQAGLFSGMDEATQAAFLDETLSGLGQAAAELARISDAWAAGDTSILEDELLADMQARYPQVYEAVFVARNRDWTEQLTAELEGSGTDFVVVGAGHLVGENGVPAMLEARGYAVERIGGEDER